MNELKNRESAEKYRLETELKNAKEVAAKINGKTVKLTAKAGQGGKLFGSVTAKEVAESISHQFGVSVDKRKVSMEDIKSFGTFSAEVKAGNGANATVYVSVARNNFRKPEDLRTVDVNNLTLPEGYQMPFSLEAEQAVLGCVLMDPNCMPQVLIYLRPEYFYLPQHREIFSVAR